MIAKQIIAGSALTNYQIQTLRICKGTGANTPGGSLDTVQLVYVGSTVDDWFNGVRIYDSDRVTPLDHRRINIVPGVSADFIIQVSLSAGQTKNIYIDVVSGASQSTDAILETICPDGFFRYNGHGIMQTYSGLEPCVRYENGVYRMWYSKLQGTKPPPYPWTHGDVMYLESATGVFDFTSPQTCVTRHGRNEVNVGPDGKYHMLCWSWDDLTKIDYYRSDTGAPGTWALIKAGAITVAAGTGNNSFIWEGNTVKVVAEYASGGSWYGGLWTGPDLENLSAYAGNPVITPPAGHGATSSGHLQLVKYNNKYVILGHDSNVTTSAVPTENTYFTADALEGPWTFQHWSLRMQPLWNNDPAKPSGSDSQTADPYIVQAGNVTHMYYEEIWQQLNDIPSMSLSRWPLPVADILDTAKTKARWDDLSAEGWAYDVGHAEIRVGAAYPTSYMRKDSVTVERMPVSVRLHVNSANANGIWATKGLNLSSDESVIDMSVRGGNLNAMFQFMRVEKSDNNILVLAGMLNGGQWFYYNGVNLVTTGAWSINTWYRVKCVCKTTGYDLYLDETLIAAGISYYSAFARPHHIHPIMQRGADTTTSDGYIGYLATRKYVASEPSWGPATDIAGGYYYQMTQRRHAA